MRVCVCAQRTAGARDKRTGGRDTGGRWFPPSAQFATGFLLPPGLFLDSSFLFLQPLTRSFLSLYIFFFALQPPFVPVRDRGRNSGSGEGLSVVPAAFLFFFFFNEVR